MTGESSAPAETTASSGNGESGDPTTGEPDPLGCGDIGIEPVVHFSFDGCEGGVSHPVGDVPSLELTDSECAVSDSLSQQLEASSWASGTSLWCNGSALSKAEAADDPSFEPAEFTISAWVLASNYDCGPYPDEGNCTVLSKGHTDSTGAIGYWLSVSNGKPMAQFNGNGSEDSAVVDTVLEPNRWYQLVMTFDGATGRIYLDGQPGEWTTVANGIEYGPEPLTFCQIPNRNYDLDGLIDEFKLWDFAMTVEEVAGLHASYLDCSK